MCVLCIMYSSVDENKVIRDLQKTNPLLLLGAIAKYSSIQCF